MIVLNLSKKRIVKFGATNKKTHSKTHSKTGRHT